MTTIVATLTEMAADTLMTGDGAKTSVTKIYRVGKSLYGGCGEVEAIAAFIQWAQSSFNKKEKPVWGTDIPDFMILELGIAGIRFWGARLVPMTIEAEYYSIGSGSMCAMAAMACGKTPAEAIHIAALFDENTGHGVQIERLKK